MRAPRPRGGSGGIEAIPKRRIRWRKAYRIVSTRYPPIDVFERIAPRGDWEALASLEMLTNPRLRDETGDISLVPRARRVTGPGASIVMAPFTHVSPDRPTRFSNGAYGVYNAASRLETALREVVHHRTRFHTSTNDPPTDSDFRAYAGSIDSELHDISGGRWDACLEPDDYAAAQSLGRRLRDAGSNGIVYPSVRHAGGNCVAAFWPDVVDIPRSDRMVRLRWNGRAISHWLEIGRDEWQQL